MVFFEDLFGVPRRGVEEGGQLVLPQVCLGEVFGGLGVGAPLLYDWGDLRGKGLLRCNVRGEGFGV
jgi:hypothetical protein